MSALKLIHINKWGPGVGGNISPILQIEISRNYMYFRTKYFFQNAWEELPQI